MKLTFKIFMVFITLAVITTLVLGISLYFTINNAIQEKIAQHQIHFALRTIDSIDQFMYERLINLRLLSADEDLRHILRHDYSKKEIVDKKFKEMRSATKLLDVLCVIDKDGRYLYSNSEHNIGSKISSKSMDFKAFKTAKTGKIYYSDLVVSDESEKPSIVCAVDIKDFDKQGNHSMGVLIVHISWEEALQFLINKQGARVHLFNKQGFLIGDSDKEKWKNILKTRYTDNPSYNRALKLKQHYALMPSIKGDFYSLTVNAYQRGYKDYKGNGWMMIVEVPVKQIFAEAKKKAFNLVIVYISIIIVFITVIILFISAVVLKPVSKITSAVKSVAGGNLDQKVPVLTNDEFGELALYFNDMTKELKILYANLEEKVKERTSELSGYIKKLEETDKELKVSNAELERFSYVVSHDLQEPLRTIAGYIELLKLRYKGKLDKNADNFIDNAISGAERMRLLIDSLLEYSRTGKIKEHKSVDISDVLEKVMFNLKSSIKKNNAEILKEKMPVIAADENEILRLFQNLISNAIKFRSGLPPKIHIGVKEDEKEYIFSVSDNGIGFDQNRAEDLFYMFKRLHVNDEFEGKGIGLAVCKNIVENYGGKIWAESSPGGGAAFYFTMPKK